MEEQGCKTLLHGDDTSQEAQGGPPVPPILELHLSTAFYPSCLGYKEFRASCPHCSPTCSPGIMHGCRPQSHERSVLSPTSPLWRTFQNSSCSSGAHSVGCSHQPEASVIFCKSPLNLSKDSLAPPPLPSSWGRQQVSFPWEALHSLLSP